MFNFLIKLQCLIFSLCFCVGGTLVSALEQVHNDNHLEQFAEFNQAHHDNIDDQSHSHTHKHSEDGPEHEHQHDHLNLSIYDSPFFKSDLSASLWPRFVLLQKTFSIIPRKSQNFKQDPFRPPIKNLFV